MRALVIGLVLLAGSAFARDGYQDRPHACDMVSGPRLVRCQEWISTVKRPDYPSSCCGDADSVIVDNIERGPNGELIAIVTADYPELPGYEQDDGSISPPGFSIHKGDKIVIPPEKVNHLPEDANRSSHGVVFIMPSNGQVLCFFFPPLV